MLSLSVKQPSPVNQFDVFFFSFLSSIVDIMKYHISLARVMVGVNNMLTPGIWGYQNKFPKSYLHEES